MENLRGLLGLPEDRSRLVRDQEPAAAPVLEHVRHEGVEAQRIAVLAQQLYLLGTDGPRDVATGVNVRFRQRDRYSIELAETHLPGFLDALPADHDCRAERAHERDVGLVSPQPLHRLNVACRYRRQEDLARGVDALDV